MRLPLRLLILLIVCTTATVSFVRGDDAPGIVAEKAIEEAITLLEARKASAGTVNEKDKIAAAVAALQKQIVKKEAAKPQELPEITPAMLHKKFHGRAVYSPKTGELSLVYDWSSKNQLLDFESVYAKPTLVRGGLLVQGGSSLQHVVDFTEVTIAVPVLIQKMQGMLIKTSGGFFAELGGFHRNTMYLGDAKQRKEHIVPAAQLTGVQHVRLVVTSTHLGFDYGDESHPNRLGLGRTEIHAGKVELHGGDLGYQFGNLVLSGKVAQEWAAEFFAK